MKDLVKFFLGANSHINFVSYFKQLQEQSDSMQLLILKGGPGSGKSSLMKRVIKYALKKNHEVEIIPCASDPNSIDAFIDKTADFAMMDGTAPHTEDPSLPGANHHILYTGDLWDTAYLYKYASEIKSLNGRIGDYHKGAGSYIKAASALLYENLLYSKKYINKSAITSFANEICKSLSTGNYKDEKVRLLSAVSVGEIKYFKETLPLLADKIFVIEDDFGGVADFLMKNIKHTAEYNGTQIISCPCSIMPEKTDHIIIPDAKIAVVTQNRFLPIDFGEKKSAEKFYCKMPDRLLLEARQSDAQKLLGKACTLVKEAKLLHDDLEDIYKNAMDFSGMDGFFEDIIKKFY
ncbi:MAG: hypothetical protein IJE41_02360 [Clostridia bacterium]|nr:hypothetical protein [Clostridia bacterium]